MVPINERAAHIIEPVLGTKEAPKLHPSNYSEGLRLAVNLLRADSGVRGFDMCTEVGAPASCITCRIIGHKICDLVEADKQELTRPSFNRNI